MAYQEYKPVLIEAVYPDGTVMVRNRFIQENSAVRSEDPHWPRKRLIDLATTYLHRWIEGYGDNSVARLRLVK